MTDRSSVIFGNKMPDKVYKKAVKSKKKYMKKFGDDSQKNYEVAVEKNRYIGDSLGVYNILVGNPAENVHYDVNAHAEKGTFDTEKGIIVGNIRMGFGHYRISMAMASAAKAMGYTPYWMDLNSYGETTCTKVIGAQNDLYSSAQYLKPELSKIQLDVAGYDKNATAIYMVMLDGDGERTVRRMTEKIVGSGIYQSTAELKPCKYFFALSADSDYPCYMKGENGDNSLQYVTEEGDYEMLENTKRGTYTMVVDLNVFDVNIVSLYPLPKDGIWIVGNSCDVGWDLGVAKDKGALTSKDPRHPELWTYTGNFHFNGGDNEFKLSVDLDWGGKFFFAPNAGANPAAEHELGEARYQDAGGDLKWSVASDGKYTLTVDLNEMKIYLNPAE